MIERRTQAEAAYASGLTQVYSGVPVAAESGQVRRLLTRRAAQLRDAADARNSTGGITQMCHEEGGLERET